MKRILYILLLFTLVHASDRQTPALGLAPEFQIFTGNPDYHAFPMIRIPITISGAIEKVPLEPSDPAKRPPLFQTTILVNGNHYKSIFLPIAAKEENKPTPPELQPKPTAVEKPRLMLLMDISGSMGKMSYNKARQIAMEIARKLSSRVDICFGTFGDYVYLPALYSDNESTISQRLQHAPLSERNTYLYKTMLQALDHQRKPDLMAILTDGIDRGSHTDLDHIVKKAQEKNISIALYSFGRHPLLQSLGHAVLATGGKIFPEPSPVQEFTDYLSKWFQNAAKPVETVKAKVVPANDSKPNIPVREFTPIRTAMERYSQDLEINLRDFPGLFWPQQKLTIMVQHNRIQWERDLAILLPLQIWIPYLITESPWISLSVLFALFLLFFVVLLSLLLRRRQMTVVSVPGEDRSTRPMPYPYHSKSSQEDVAAYQKLYSDRFPQQKQVPVRNNALTEELPPLSLRLPEKMSATEEVKPATATASKDEFVVQSDAFLEIMNGALQKKRFALYYIETTIGRDDDASITIQDPYLSPLHFKIKNVNGTFMLFDTLSQNGTFLNQKKLVRPKQMVNWDEIKAGRTVFQFRVSGKDAAGS